MDERRQGTVMAVQGNVVDVRFDGFLDDFLLFQARVAELGIYNSLSQTLLRLTAPGVPELYQGAELWELTLVDPDNRRPVDFGRRQAMLAELQTQIEAASEDLAPLARRLLDERVDGRVKLYVLHRALTYRGQHPRLFHQGDYVPLEVSRGRSNHVCAFLRSRDREEIVVAVPRLLASLAGAGPPVGTTGAGSCLSRPCSAPSRSRCWSGRTPCEPNS